jgi:hypothetical protein
MLATMAPMILSRGTLPAVHSNSPSSFKRLVYTKYNTNTWHIIGQLLYVASHTKTHYTTQPLSTTYRVLRTPFEFACFNTFGASPHRTRARGASCTFVSACARYAIVVVLSFVLSFVVLCCRVQFSLQPQVRMCCGLT